MDKGIEANIKRIDKNRWEVPIGTLPNMRVPGMIYASAVMMEAVKRDRTMEQVANVAQLPGILSYSFAMPDIHWGYGFPIGGVAAMDLDEGVISPGGVGYDINCGVRLIRTNFTDHEIKPHLEKLLNALYNNIPSGVGSEGRIKLNPHELDAVARGGASWAVEQGYGSPEDLKVIEENGALSGAEPSVVSSRAKERGKKQLGTLGSGNHFLEIQRVEKIYDPRAAEVMGLAEGQVVLLIHTGSRGFGYQVCADSLRGAEQASRKYGIALPDRQLASMPISSPEGKNYLAAMACAMNYAFANRQLITHWVRDTFEQVLRGKCRDFGLEIVYDVAHNSAKIEEHSVGGRTRKVLVHRKGATRAFGPGDKRVPAPYRDIGQPVFIPGDMGRASYVLLGTQKAMEETFGSTCHGAGRLMSRTAAMHQAKGRDLTRELKEKYGVLVKTGSWESLAEEIPEAYKDVSEVVDVVDRAGISRKVAKMVPLATIKG